MGTKLPPDGAAAIESVVLNWRYPDGSMASGHPLPREQAERLARVYGGMYPDQTYWLEPVRMDETLAYARVRRRRPQLQARNTK
jgi:hypothetical protein